MLMMVWANCTALHSVVVGRQLVVGQRAINNSTTSCLPTTAVTTTADQILPTLDTDRCDNQQRYRSIIPVQSEAID